MAASAAPVVRIVPIRADQAEAGKRVIVTVCLEIFGQRPATARNVDQGLARWSEQGVLKDMSEIACGQG